MKAGRFVGVLIGSILAVTIVGAASPAAFAQTRQQTSAQFIDAAPAALPISITTASVAHAGFWDYANCIFRTGLPIGLAIALVAFPPALPLIGPTVYSWARNPISAGQYFDQLTKSCGRFFGGK